MKPVLHLVSQCVDQQGEEGGPERTADVFRDLAALLKSRSPHFAASVINQVKYRNTLINNTFRPSL